MPNITTSISNELFIEAQNRGIGWSKALKLGIEMCLNEGVDTLPKLKLEIISVKDALELKTIRVEEQTKTINDLKYKFIRKIIELTMPDLHHKLINREQIGEINIMEIRTLTGEKLGILDISEAYGYDFDTKEDREAMD